MGGQFHALQGTIPYNRALWRYDVYSVCLVWRTDSIGLAVSSDERSDRAHFDAQPGHVLDVSSKTDETSNVQGYSSAELVPDVPRSWIAGVNSPLVLHTALTNFRSIDQRGVRTLRMAK